ncbi:MAG: hypothetical protein H6841_07705 [Planctomycetes bacterium]|nr:hypothetical protein [Planctomycetota bacterium]MCB9935243.1 hypothetical protein [Planctomycetota bacterium]
MRYLTVLLLTLCAARLAAQQLPPGTQPPPASAAKESFVIQPGAVERGARNLAIRLVANEAAGFANSSSKPPALTFGVGVKLVAGSFNLLNQNEAQAAIDVESDVEGTIEVKLELFSVNGTTVLKTLRGSLGIKGVTDVAGSQAKVGAESVKLVQVNVSESQPAGVILISGGISGSVSIKAPAGCAFSELPTITAGSGDINSPALATANTVLTFAIGNPALANVTVRVEGIRYNTQLFGLAGGVEGDLACEVTGAALSNQSALVVNAFTARTTIAGSNDNTDSGTPAGTPAGSQSSNSTSKPTSPSPSSINTGSRPLETSNRDRTNRNRNNNNQGGAGSNFRPSTQPSQQGQSRGPGLAPLPQNSQPAPGQAPGPAQGPAGGGAAKAGGAASPMGGTGSISSEEVDPTKPDTGPGTTRPLAKVLEVTPGLYFCDKDYKPVSALVLDKIIAGEAGGRVWIVLKLKKDKQHDKVETVTVKLTVAGSSRELTLTETGKDTGEFRCGKDGILVVANENPDSNAEEKAAEPPKPRFDR